MKFFRLLCSLFPTAIPLSPLWIMLPFFSASKSNNKMHFHEPTNKQRVTEKTHTLTHTYTHKLFGANTSLLSFRPFRV